VIIFNIPTKTVGDIVSISGVLPKFHLPKVPLSFETLKIIFPYSLIMALVGLIESLLTLTVIDEMTESRGRGNKESIAQGIANFICGFFGGMGGCAMIGQSIINVSSGGRKRLSTIVAPITLLIFILFGSSFIEKVPMAALVGLMFMVAIGTFEWASLKMFRSMPKTDIFVMVTVALVTVIFHNLAVAVFIGIIISSLAFAWEHATNIHARPRINKDNNKVYDVDGPLFFGSTTQFLDRFDIANDPETVIIDFKKSKVLDHSAIESLNKLTERYNKAGKKVHLRHLSEDCRTLLANASAIIEVNYWEDTKYKMVSGKLA
ncbi:SulP family inorganic anion transporter, partial [Methanococcoides sp. SA1]|nr:SulP family inorganic anion transporter [Methanococcoides sp. SA1]